MISECTFGFILTKKILLLFPSSLLVSSVSRAHLPLLLPPLPGVPCTRSPQENRRILSRSLGFGEDPGTSVYSDYLGVGRPLLHQPPNQCMHIACESPSSFPGASLHSVPIPGTGGRDKGWRTQNRSPGNRKGSPNQCIQKPGFLTMGFPIP